MTPILLGLWFVDQWLTDDDYVGWERNTVRNAQRRWESRPRARIAIMGSSTSKDWLSTRKLAKYLGRRAGDIVDAHMNGCHQDCTWAEVRLMLQRHRLKRCRWRGKDRCSPPKTKRFDAVFLGTNLFQVCENPHSKRPLQQVMLLPSEDIPDLFGIYMSAKEPLLHMGRYLGIQMSGAFGDTQAFRDYWGQKWFRIHRHPKNHLWYRAKPKPKKKKIKSCDYAPKNVALKLRFTQSLLDDLKHVSVKTYLMILPDSSLSLDSEEHRRRWALHLTKHQALADARPWVELIDLATEGIHDPDQYTDGFHLKRQYYGTQQTLLHQRLKALGVPAKKRKKGSKR